MAVDLRNNRAQRLAAYAGAANMGYQILGAAGYRPNVHGAIQAAQDVGRGVRRRLWPYEDAPEQERKHVKPNPTRPQSSSKMYRTGGYYGFAKKTICPPKCEKRELKFKDFIYSAASLATYGGIKPIVNDSGTGALTTVAEGDGPDERQGRTIRIHEIDCSLYIGSSTQTTSTSPTNIKIELWLDRQWNKQNGTTDPDYNLIYKNSGVSDVSDMPELSNASRFKLLMILFDVILDPVPYVQTGSAVTNMGYQNARVSKKWSAGKTGLPITYTEVTTGAPSEVTSNGLFLIARKYAGESLTTLSGVVRIRFTD